jgi:hypothetical protein
VKYLALGLVLALAGAGISGAVLTGTLPLLQTQNASSEEPYAGWEVLETFTGDAAGITEGALDLRAFWGNIQVVGWSQESYEITVLTRGGEQGQGLSDAGVEAVFAEDRAEGLSLSLVLQRTGTYNVGVNGQHADYAIVANVPSAIAWKTAFVCSGMEHGSVLRQALAPIMGALHEDSGSDERDLTCVEGSPMLNLNIGRIRVDDNGSDEEVVAVPFAVSDLAGGELIVMAQYADLAFEGVAFDTAMVHTQYGDITGSLAAAETSIMTQYGDIGMVLTADKLEVMSQYGDLHLAVADGGAGAYNVGTQYGDLTIGLPSDPAFGFDAEALTQYGEALIVLDGIEYSSEDEEDDGTAVANTKFVPGFPGMPGKPGGKSKSYNHGSEVTAQSEHFDSAPIQVLVKAWTQYGDVLVTNGAMPEAEADDDQGR